MFFGMAKTGARAADRASTSRGLVMNSRSVQTADLQILYRRLTRGSCAAANRLGQSKAAQVGFDLYQGLRPRA